MRVLVCGGRAFTDFEYLEQNLDRLNEFRGPFTAVIHGAASGADMGADAWAKKRGIPVEAFPAEWKRFGKQAGPIRNTKMLHTGKPQIVIAFPGGRGTTDMAAKAVLNGVEVIQVPPRA